MALDAHAASTLGTGGRKKARSARVFSRRRCICVGLIGLPAFFLSALLHLLCNPQAVMALLKDPIHHALFRGGLDSWQARRILPDSCYIRPNPALLADPSLMRKAEVLYGTMDAMCGLLNATHVKNIAVVGNGPVTSEQRDQIQHADRVVRFNALNNRLMQEASDVWIVRYSGKPPSHFWGLGTLDKGELVDILRTSQLVLFLGGPDPPRYIPMDQMLELMRKVLPDTPPSKLLQIKFERYRHVYNSVLSSSLTLEKPEAEPSSGLLGLLATLGCIASDATVNVYGFNWSGKAYELHFMEDERRIVSRLQRRYPGLQIHPTACAGNLYSCSEACDRVLYRKAIDGDNPAICKVRRFHEEHGRPNFGVLDSLV